MGFVCLLQQLMASPRWHQEEAENHPARDWHCPPSAQGLRTCLQLAHATGWGCTCPLAFAARGNGFFPPFQTFPSNHKGPETCVKPKPPKYPTKSQQNPSNPGAGTSRENHPRAPRATPGHSSADLGQRLGPGTAGFLPCRARSRTSAGSRAGAHGHAASPSPAELTAARAAPSHRVPRTSATSRLSWTPCGLGWRLRLLRNSGDLAEPWGGRGPQRAGRAARPPGQTQAARHWWAGPTRQPHWHSRVASWTPRAGAPIPQDSDVGRLIRAINPQTGLGRLGQSFNYSRLPGAKQLN